jgi:hypothetical protein
VLVRKPPANADLDPAGFNGYLAELEALLREQFELAERRDWNRYALGRPVDDEPLLESRRSLAALFAEPEVPALLEPGGPYDTCSRHLLASFERPLTGARVAERLRQRIRQAMSS